MRYNCHSKIACFAIKYSYDVTQSIPSLACLECGQTLLLFIVIANCTICGMRKVICGIEIAKDCWLAKWKYHVTSPFPQITRQSHVSKTNWQFINTQQVYRSDLKYCATSYINKTDENTLVKPIRPNRPNEMRTVLMTVKHRFNGLG